ncbi:MAG: SDR family oxidoreductase [Chloroflexi bacterium]|nr:SDR family oxidoreductase [Chloroflexota bacterium]
MDLGLKNKVALVTAASRGLGKAVALELAREGALVAICSRNAEAIDSAAADIRKQTGAEVLALAGDVTDAGQIARVAEETAKRWGGIDALFANAGGPPPGPFMQFSDEQWLSAVQLNLMSVVRLCRAVLPGMQGKRWGRIVIDTSFTVKQPLENLILSNAIRAGVVGMAKTLASEVAKDGVTVNCICPGWIQTERVDQLLDNRAKANHTAREAEAKALSAAIPAGRIGRVEEFAAAAAFLMSDRASYITGTALTVDGGIVKGLFG